MKPVFRRIRTAVTCQLVAGLLSHSIALATLPTGYDASLSSGVTFIVTSGSTQTITTHSHNSFGSFHDFNIGSGHSVTVVQPNSSSSFLAGVRSGNPTQIHGALSSNGTVGVINAAGVFVGNSGVVNTQGFVATTQPLDKQQYLATGDLHLGASSNGTAEVVNQGHISVGDNGFILLSAPNVRNEGTIRSQGGEVNLIAAQQVLALQTSDGLRLNLAGSALGEGFHGIVNTTGTLTASRLMDGPGGSIRLLASQVDVAGLLQANGVNEGGNIIVGGLFQGKGSEALNAQATTVHHGATLQANALTTGDGGQVIVWADGHSQVDGHFEAQGGSLSGNGGLIETSGKINLTVGEHTTVNTQASHGDTGLWLLDPENITIANSGGDITPSTIITALGSSDVTLTTNNSSGSDVGDIFVNDAISWGTNNSLTLNAFRNIEVNAAITNTGLGNLTLRSDSTGTGTGTVHFGGGGSVSLTSGQVDLFYNPTSYAAPTNYSGNITGTHTAWMLVHDVNDLQAMNTNLSGSYALSKNIDASATGSWNGGLGFEPVGDNSNLFTGNLNGQNYTIDGLTINRPGENNIALFGRTQTSLIKNVGLINVNITGATNVSSLVARAANSVIKQSYSTGSVNGATSAAGLIARNENGSLTVDSNSIASVTSSGGGASGGLVGLNNNGSIVRNSFAAGNVNAMTTTGGLVGRNLSNSIIENSYAIGEVNGTSNVGGLVGENSINSSIRDSYATGSVQGVTNVGGLTGRNFDSSLIERSYSAGQVTGTSNVGGLLGGNITSTVTDSYWNLEASGQSSSVAGTGLTTAQTQQASSYSGWDISTTGGSSSVWRIYEGQTAPLLRSFLKPLEVTPTNTIKVFDNSALVNGSVSYSGFSSGDGPSSLLGTLQLNSDSPSVGTHTLRASGLYSNQQGYDIQFNVGTVSIRPNNLQTLNTLNKSSEPFLRQLPVRFQPVSVKASGSQTPTVNNIVKENLRPLVRFEQVNGTPKLVIQEKTLSTDGTVQWLSQTLLKQENLIKHNAS